MGEFRIGMGGPNARAQHVYPDNPRAAAISAFARNYATGPKIGQAIGPGGLSVPWNAVDAGTPPTTADVPITARATGIVLVTGVVTLSNSTGGDVVATVTVHVDGVAVSTPFAAGTVPNNGNAAIPFMAETDPSLTPVGATHQIEIFIDGNGLELESDGSVVDVQEVSVATG